MNTLTKALDANSDLATAIKYDDIDFLKFVVARYPETKRLAESANASPEGNQQLRPGALTYAVFENVDVNVIEAERTLISILLLKDVLTDERTHFEHLSKEGYIKLRSYTYAVLTTIEQVESVLYALACNDLGKTHSLRNLLNYIGPSTEDHDQLLARLVIKCPRLFPGMHLLTQEQRAYYIDGLLADFNLGQFVQGESLPYNLIGIQQLSDKARNLRLLVELYDFAGAVTYNGQFNDNALSTYLSAIQHLTTEPLDGSYERYIYSRAPDQFHADFGLAMGRLIAQARFTDPEDCKLLDSVFRELPRHIAETLLGELNCAWKKGKKPIMLYYAPAVFANAIKALGKKDGLRHALFSLAAEYQAARNRLSAALKKPEVVDIRPTALQMTKLIQNNSKRLSSLRTEESVAFIGIGGGSDCIQAAILSQLITGCACVISIRSAKTASQGANGELGVDRSISNVFNISPDVFEIRLKTTGSGRVLEPLSVELGIMTYMIIDREDGKLSSKIQDVLDDCGSISKIYAIDTGGDSLYSRAYTKHSTRATPDQDHCSLLAIAELGIESYSVIVAKGVDSPDYADAILFMAEATEYTFDQCEKEFILERYKSIRLDGSDDTRYGKTCFAWQAALRGERGNVTLPLPERIINDAVNPWNPIVNVTDTMANVHVMELSKHLTSIGLMPDVNLMNEADGRL